MLPTPADTGPCVGSRVDAPRASCSIGAVLGGEKVILGTLALSNNQAKFTVRDGASFTLYSHTRSRVDSCTAGDLTGGNAVLYSIAHQKADRNSVVLAANGPDRRVGGIGAFWVPKRFLV